MRLDVSHVKKIPNSGIEILEGQTRQRIEAWWSDNRIAFTVFFNDLNVSEKATTAHVEEQEFAAGLLFFNSDFEAGDLTNWSPSGNAFQYQPTKGDNTTARKSRQPSGHLDDYWIGTFEKYNGKPHERPGSRQGDRPTGRLRSISFQIVGSRIGFLIGGGRKISKLSVSLMVEGREVRKTTGKNSETMERVIWDVGEFQGKTGRIIIKDESSSGWGHINIDDFRFM